MDIDIIKSKCPDGTDEKNLSNGYVQSFKFKCNINFNIKRYWSCKQGTKIYPVDYKTSSNIVFSIFDNYYLKYIEDSCSIPRNLYNAHRYMFYISDYLNAIVFQEIKEPTNPIYLKINLNINPNDVKSFRMEYNKEDDKTYFYINEKFNSTKDGIIDLKLNKGFMTIGGSCVNIQNMNYVDTIGIKSESGYEIYDFAINYREGDEQ